MTQNGIDYPIFIDQAMRSAVREVLRSVEKTGLPGEHHFYISFGTTHPGVKMSEQLRSRYPKDITIVLQHQFWDFKVEESQFQVTLSFGGAPEKLVVPFAALTAFADPSVKFGLQFQANDMFDAEIAGNESTITLPAVAPKADEAAAASAEVISLDAFRKK